MQDVVIFGTGGFAEVADYYFTHDQAYRVVAFTVDGRYVREPSFHGRPVVAFEEIEKDFPPSAYGMFVAVGIGKVNQARAAKVAEAEAKGYRLVSFVSPKADVGADLTLQPNTMIMERATIQPFVSIGRDTIIWSATRVAFGARIGSHCWLVAALLGERVVVGDYTFIGLNATVAPRVSLGQRNIIGAGALIMKDTKDLAVYKGQASEPSRVPSSRLWND